MTRKEMEDENMLKKIGENAKKALEIIDKYKTSNQNKSEKDKKDGEER